MFEKIIYQFKYLRTKFVSDEKYLSKRFTKKLGYVPNLIEPKSFNEKVTFRMISERDKLHTQLADKLAVRDFVIKQVGEAYLVPLIGVYEKYQDIQFDQLPAQFVLKCTHDSGSAIVCYDKNKLNNAEASQKLKTHLYMNMYVMKREWHYKDIPAKLLIESYIPLYRDPLTQQTITTCRVHCFDSQPEFIETDITCDELGDYSNIYDTQWNLQPFKVDLKENTALDIHAPAQLPEIIALAKKLSLASGYSRVDFLLSKDRVYFSEITLTPNAGRMVIHPPEWDFKLGEYWKA